MTRILPAHSSHVLDSEGPGPAPGGMTRHTTAMPPCASRLRPLVLALVLAVAVAGCAAETATWREPQPSPLRLAGTTPPPFEGWSDPAGVGQPFGTKVKGLLTFRGNPTRTFYGTGPAVRSNPTELWAFPKDSNMCGPTSIKVGEVQAWCGNGWTGQPAVIERGGRTWIITGGYDHHIHFVDAATGERILPDFVTGDLVKGSLALDPDGYPLVYTGSRDGYFRILSYDGDKPVELWKLNGNSVQPKYGDDDWDSSGLVIDDYLFQNSENGNFHIIKLNRGYDPAARSPWRRSCCTTSPVGTRSCRRSTGTTRSRTRSRSTRTSPTSPTHRAWCRAGISAGSRPVRRRPRYSASGRRRRRRHHHHRRAGHALRRGPLGAVQRPVP